MVDNILIDPIGTESGDKSGNDNFLGKVNMIWLGNEGNDRNGRLLGLPSSRIGKGCVKSLRLLEYYLIIEIPCQMHLFQAQPSNDLAYTPQTWSPILLIPKWPHHPNGGLIDSNPHWLRELVNIDRLIMRENI